MNIRLDQAEARVLGCLVEKQITTPEYYPLTLNALTNACNQKSNREPIASLEERDVVRALDSLREKTLARRITGPDHRVPKYAHLMDEALDLDKREVAVLTVLLLRGPQTCGEIRTHSARLFEFADPEEVESTLRGLASSEGVWRPLAVRLPRQVGRKEPRYAHLLCGEPEVPQAAEITKDEPVALEVRAEKGRLAVLETEVTALRGEVEALRRTLEEFRKQFE